MGMVIILDTGINPDTGHIMSTAHIPATGNTLPPFPTNMTAIYHRVRRQFITIKTARLADTAIPRRKFTLNPYSPSFVLAFTSVHRVATGVN